MVRNRHTQQDGVKETDGKVRAKWMDKSQKKARQRLAIENEHSRGGLGSDEGLAKNYHTGTGNLHFAPLENCLTQNRHIKYLLA